jgi:hypothetical protein
VRRQEGESTVQACRAGWMEKSWVRRRQGHRIEFRGRKRETPARRMGEGNPASRSSKLQLLNPGAVERCGSSGHHLKREFLGLLEPLEPAKHGRDWRDWATSSVEAVISGVAEPGSGLAWAGMGRHGQA